MYVLSTQKNEVCFQNGSPMMYFLTRVSKSCQVSPASASSLEPVRIHQSCSPLMPIEGQLEGFWCFFEHIFSHVALAGKVENHRRSEVIKLV